MTIGRMNVNSTNLSSVSYDSDESTMEVTFKTGRTYRYLNVPVNVYQELASAPSPGSYFASQVRNVYETEAL